MKAKINFLVLLLASFIWGGCQDFISANLKKKQINVLSPADGYHSTSSSIVFWWDEVKGAETYGLQVVQPSFSGIQKLIIDTNVIAPRFIMSLLPGSYQWRVRATNNAGSTQYVTYTLTVDSTYDLTAQTVVLSLPADNFITNRIMNVFRWDSLYNATDYRLQIINQAASSTVLDITTQTDTFSFTLSEGTYKWQVRAENGNSNSPYSYRTITIDTTAPPVSSIVSPINNASVTNPVTISWTRDVSATGDSLIIYPDSLISLPVYSGFHSALNYNFTGISTHNYFWRLRSADAAGNFSQYSNLNKFIVQ